jgi:hypothetical protein
MEEDRIAMLHFSMDEIREIALNHKRGCELLHIHCMVGLMFATLTCSLTVAAFFAGLVKANIVK